MNMQLVREILSHLRKAEQAILWASRRIPGSMRFKSEGAEMETVLTVAASVLLKAAGQIKEMGQHLQPDLIDQAAAAGEVKVEKHTRKKPKKPATLREAGGDPNKLASVEEVLQETHQEFADGFEEVFPVKSPPSPLGKNDLGR